MKEQNLILLIALVVANLMSDRIKPLVDNMVKIDSCFDNLLFSKQAYYFRTFRCNSLYFYLQWFARRNDWSRGKR